MPLVLFRNLGADRGRTLLSVLAVGASILVVVALEGFKAGLWQQVRAYPARLPVQLVAAQSGTANLISDKSVLPPDTMLLIAELPGVRSAHPLVRVPMIFDQDGIKTPVTIVGYHEVGGPWRLQSGRLPSAEAAD
jgi:hypothetical protein